MNPEDENPLISVSNSEQRHRLKFFGLTERACSSGEEERWKGGGLGVGGVQQLPAAAHRPQVLSITLDHWGDKI